jgi:hypothetical protein
LVLEINILFFSIPIQIKNLIFLIKLIFSISDSEINLLLFIKSIIQLFVFGFLIYKIKFLIIKNLFQFFNEFLLKFINFFN